MLFYSNSFSFSKHFFPLCYVLYYVLLDFPISEIYCNMPMDVENVLWRFSK